MIVFVNNEPVELPGQTTSVGELLASRNVSPNGTAVAVNNRMIKHDMWLTTLLSDRDMVTIISAAFGG